MRGITPIISIIIILLITISLAAAAWSYISGYWFGLVGTGIEITHMKCTDGTSATIYIHNIGTERLNMDSGIDVTRTDCPGCEVIEFSPTDGVVEAGGVGQIIDTNCAGEGERNRCSYDILHLPSGRLHSVSVDCYG